ncbi:hypothetical protein [Metallosphaera tengchongensis]|nr:hypothetical protein [Metallosphaera tengchongensis]
MFSEVCSRFASEAFYDYPLLMALQINEMETELEEIMNKFFRDNLVLKGEKYQARRGSFYFDDENATEGYENDYLAFQVIYADKREYLSEKEELLKGLKEDSEETEDAEIYAFITTLMEYTLTALLFKGREGEPDCVKNKKCYLSLKYKK